MRVLGGTQLQVRSEHGLRWWERRLLSSQADTVHGSQQGGAGLQKQVPRAMVGGPGDFPNSRADLIDFCRVRRKWTCFAVLVITYRTRR